MSLDEAASLVRAGQHFLVTCHRRPDADALGSALGFVAILRSLGKEATLFTPDALSPSVAFLPGVQEIAREVPEEACYDGVFIMDTASAELLPTGLPGAERTGVRVIVDHHAAHDDFGDIVLRDTRAVATAEVVIALAARLGIEDFSKDAATALYAALVADTGGFRYPGTSPATLRLGARLLDAGVDPWHVASNLFEKWPAARMKLLGAVLETLETDLGGRLALLRVTRQMLRDHGATDDMVEGLVNYGRRLVGVDIAALVWEWEPVDGAPITKLSLRSSGATDVSQIAVAFGGGGHRTAAGANVRGTLDEAEARVRVEAARLLAP